MIPDSAVDNAITWLSEHAGVAAKARADRKYIEEYMKTLKSELRMEKEGPQAEKDDHALTHERYREMLEGLRDAVKKDEWYRWKCQQQHAIIEAWQTQSANRRANI